MNPTRWNLFRLGWLPTMAAMLALASLGSLPTQADEIMLTIEATGADGSGTLQIGLDDGVWDGSTFNWSATDDIALRSGSDVIATLAAGTFISASMPTGGDPLRMPPKVSLGFAVQAGGSDTAFTISSSLVTFDPMVDPAGRATAVFTLTDGESDGGWLSGDGPMGGGYLAQYNGFVPSGTTFAEVLGDLTVGPGDTIAEAVNIPEVGFLPIDGVVTNMSSQIAFTLSALDLASGTTNWELVPEPASLGLLAAGLLVLRRRR
jgi:hypothetical protein